MPNRVRRVNVKKKLQKMCSIWNAFFVFSMSSTFQKVIRESTVLTQLFKYLILFFI